MVELMEAAPTGSGKTLAFLIPLILRVMKQKKDEPDVAGVRAVVISPTKELNMDTGRRASSPSSWSEASLQCSVESNCSRYRL